MLRTTLRSVRALAVAAALGAVVTSAGMAQEAHVVGDWEGSVAAGGQELRYVPALNARDDHIAFLSRTIEKNVAGWPEASPDWSLSEASRKLEKSLQRARDMGAER